jgi:hypothetical protein
MKVYCVCFYNMYEGTYCPKAVFSTLEKAEEYIKTLRPDDDQSGHSVLDYEIDQPEES